MANRTTMNETDVVVYSTGLICCSVCAPKTMTGEEVAAKVNVLNHPGVGPGWMPSNDKTFKGGEPMPNQCEDDPNRQHWLLEC